MDLKSYFENTQGLGVLSTSDQDGNVDAAIYARPHVIDDSTVALVMGEKTTYHNLKANPNAAFLFREDGEGYQGIRLFMTKIREETDPEKIDSFLRKRYELDQVTRDVVRYFVTFHILKTAPLLGPGRCHVLQATADDVA